MKVAIILGNRMNDDGTISEIMRKRLELTLELEKDFNPDYIIVSGGIANKKAGLSEASQMYKYLVEKGLPKEKIIMEDNSHTTVENAKFSIPIAKKLLADTIIVCSSVEHFTKVIYNVIDIFRKEIKDNFDNEIKLITYTKCE